MNPPDPPQPDKLPSNVLKLGLVSLLTDLDSEMVFSVFTTTVVGASSALLGLIEGLADFSASSLNYPGGLVVRPQRQAQGLRLGWGPALRR